MVDLMVGEPLPEGGERGISTPGAGPMRVAGNRIEEVSRGTFTTQGVPALVFRAVDALTKWAGLFLADEFKPHAFMPHVSVRIHPNDWRWLLEYYRQQGELDERLGPNIGSLEVNGITVLQDLGAKVPHLELRA